MIFKCKMCGGTIEFESDATIGVCDSCGTKQTLPRIDSERRANLYDRANHFRRNNEFDKASGLYEQILNEDATDAEAYWSLVLCRYGIEYVEDPATHKRIPTVNRAQYTSIYDDDNYKSAINYADSSQKIIYEEEANNINEIQKGILEISGKEEPFDVFICYKETDNNGRRTPDSVLATDLYQQLTKEGYKVFFSRITLEDKIGTAYEPYIFAALNSAKVMVVLGTKAEYYNAVWVKNEWSRFLTLVRESGGEKVLIPAFRDMDPYDLPEEFSHLQALDMSKLGFMQDLVHGIKKITQKEEKRTSIETVSTSNANVASLLKRVTLFLEDGNFTEANEYCERVLDQDPENAEAYLGKLMAEKEVNELEDLQYCSSSFENSNNYMKILRFGDYELVTTLKDFTNRINERNELNRIKNIYNKATSAMANADSESEFKSVAELFASIGKYEDSDTLMKECLDKAEESRKDSIYEKASMMMQIKKYNEAKPLFESIIDWKDSSDLANLCQKELENALQKEVQKKEHRKKLLRNGIKGIITVVALAIVAVLIIAVGIPYIRYKKACSLMEQGDYLAAADLFEKLRKTEQEEEAKKENLEFLINQEKYQDALTFAEKNGILTPAIRNEIKRIETIKSDIFNDFANANVGDTVLLGEHQWIVADQSNGKMLLIAKTTVTYRRFRGNNWGNSELRQYLNGEFLDKNFTDEEKSIIREVELDSSVLKYERLVGENEPKEVLDVIHTTDKVFVLSVEEVYKYLPERADRALAWDWILRDVEIKHPALIINNRGNLVWENDTYNGVRPAMWIDLSEDFNIDNLQ